MIQHPIQKLRQRPNRKFLLFHYWRCFRHFNWFSPSVQSGTYPQFRPMRKEENHNWIVESVNSPLLHFLLHKSWLNSSLYFDPESYIFRLLKQGFADGTFETKNRTGDPDGGRRGFGDEIIWKSVFKYKDLRKIAPTDFRYFKFSEIIWERTWTGNISIIEH